MNVHVKLKPTDPEQIETPPSGTCIIFVDLDNRLRVLGNTRAVMYLSLTDEVRHSFPRRSVIENITALGEASTLSDILAEGLE